MGKEGGFLTPKAIANRMKAKGLQKLRWYCEMCHKQCRDENGFKCHLISEGHNRQMMLFVDNPHMYVSNFSNDFENSFVKLLKTRYGTRRVKANAVYQEYISDKQHLHMNATQWESLSQFVKHLGRKGVVQVDETEKGLFITYIDRDPEVIARQEALARRDRLAKDEEERNRIELQKQIERAQEQLKELEKEKEKDESALELKRDENEKLVLSLNPVNPVKPVMQTATVVKPPTLDLFDDAPEKPKKRQSEAQDDSSSKKTKLSAIDEIRLQEERKKEKLNRKDYWLFENIIVKIMNKKFADGKYYKQKGVVTRVIDKYIGEVELLDSGDVIRLDQTDLETVIPPIDGQVLIVNGAYRGELAILLGIDVDKFQATLKIQRGQYHDRMLEGVPYEDFCKLAK